MIRTHLRNIFNFVSCDRKYLTAIESHLIVFNIAIWSHSRFQKVIQVKSLTLHPANLNKEKNETIHVVCHMFVCMSHECSESFPHGMLQIAFFFCIKRLQIFSDIYLRVLSSIRPCQALKEFNIIKNVWDVTKAGWSLLFPFPENKKNKKTKNMICIFLKKYDTMLYKNFKIQYVEITFQEQWQR